MMTFSMLRRYVTSITNDASGSLSARKAVFGATYPFPPRYTDRYMPAEGLTRYVTHSYLFGGPWVIMLPLAGLKAAELEFLASEINSYKAHRRQIAAGKVFHITPPPAANNIDVLESYDSAVDTAMAVVSRAQVTENSFLFKPKGLNGNQRYRVWLESDSRSYSQAGSQIMSEGVTVPLPDPFSSDVVHIEKQP